MRTLIHDGNGSYVFTGSHVNAAAFEPIYMYPSLKYVRMVVVSAGTTKVEFTLSPIEEVKGGTANWYEEKSITGTSNFIVAVPVTALRLTGNAATYELLAT